MNYNAWKLTRVEPRETPRTDWPQCWQSAGDACKWQGAMKSKMVALKSSPIWGYLGSGVGGFDDATFQDSPPFAINSGMGWIGCDFEQERNEHMNENKVALILKIARELTDVQCEMILHRIESNPTLLANKLVKCANEWDESEHPRDENGMFAESSSGAASDDYTQKEAEQWSKAGHKIPKSKEITQKKSEIAKVKKDLEKFGHNEDIRKFDEEKLVKLQRELAEMIRDAKMEKRIGIEQKHDERIASEKKKKQEMVKRFQDVEDEMDEIEEAYGDRDKGVGFKWPETQEADEARKRYRQLRRERDKLDKMIDWKSLESQE